MKKYEKPVLFSFGNLKDITKGGPPEPFPVVA